MENLVSKVSHNPKFFILCRISAKGNVLSRVGEGDGSGCVAPLPELP
ncbi:hypothetical protein WCP94_002157 [Bilophila wadsworthia]